MYLSLVVAFQTLLQLALHAHEVFPSESGVDEAGWQGAAVSLLSPELVFHLQQTISSELEHYEPRVRNCVVDLVEWLTRREGVPVYECLADDLMTSVLTNFTRDLDSAGDQGEEADPRLLSEDGTATGPTPAAPAQSGGDAASVKTFGTAVSASASRIAHETVGWKALESSVRAIRAAVVGCGPAFVTGGMLTPQLRADIIPRGIEHINRFVRDATLNLCDALIHAATFSELEADGFDVALCGMLAKGLGDNWSQVPACVRLAPPHDSRHASVFRFPMRACVFLCARARALSLSLTHTHRCGTLLRLPRGPLWIGLAPQTRSATSTRLSRPCA